MMANTAGDTSRRRRQTKSCGRCRKRKIRCDFQYPTCGACCAAGATCLGFDSIHGTEKPRSIIRHLEEQVAHLEIELAAVKSQTYSALDGVDGAVERLASSLASATVEATVRTRKQEQLLPLHSKYFLSDSPMPRLNIQTGTSVNSSDSQDQPWRAMEFSSIPRHVVDAMLKHYCETYRSQYPSIDEQDLYKARDRVYENPQLVGYDAFVISITLAISSNTLIHIDEKRAAATTDGLWGTAVGQLEHFHTANSWERLQALQLLTHYGFLNPQHVNVGHCAAAASRLALQLGLHEEMSIQMQMKLDPTVLNTRRRMFWNAYGIDAAAHSVRCQPFKWSRPEITAKFPDSESQSTPTHSAHVWSLREIESDITMGLYYPTIAPETTSIQSSSFQSWYERIRTRLEDWYQVIRQSVYLTEKIEFHELLFQVQVLRLNRPSSRCPTPNQEMRKRAIKASIALIKEFSVLDRLGMMFMLWHAAHCIIEAGVYLLSSILIGIEFKARYQDQDRKSVCGEDINILVRYLKTFLSLIWKISRRWPKIKPHASALDAIAASFLENLQQWSDMQVSWSTEFASLKERLGQLAPFSSMLSQDQTSTIDLPQADAIDQYATLDASNPLQGKAYPVFDSSNFQASTSGEVTSIDSTWLGNQSGLDQTFNIFPASSTLDFGDPRAWDFSGLDSEEIFAALLEGGQPESLTLE